MEYSREPYPKCRGGGVQDKMESLFKGALPSKRKSPFVLNIHSHLFVSNISYYTCYHIKKKSKFCTSSYAVQSSTYKMWLAEEITTMLFALKM